ncbi:MAG TPA: hypothetical protein VFM90_13065, partial [Cyclobacteriaceae bacterium]|nr:hypothetical protein [Cyclobacteriaceae bacterium]
MLTKQTVTERSTRFGKFTTTNLIEGLRNVKLLQKLFSVGLLVSLVFPGILLAQSARSTDSRTKSAADFRLETPKGEKPAPTTERIHSSPITDQLGTGCGWSESSAVPEPILDQAMVEHNGSLYSFAGVGGGGLLSSAYKFDGTTWTTLASMPAGFEFPSAVSDGTFIYIMAGADDTGASTNGLYRYDPVANTYTAMASSSQITWNQGAAYLNGKIYKLGGSSAPGVFVNALEIYDIATNTWSAGTAYPAALGFPSVWSDGSFIYAAGGIDASSTGTIKTYRYSAGVWDDAAIADLPAERWGSASGMYNGKFVMAGGYVGA